MARSPRKFVDFCGLGDCAGPCFLSHALCFDSNGLGRETAPAHSFFIAGAISLALWPEDEQGLELTHEDCNTVRSLAADAGLQELNVAQIFRAAAAQADSRGALSQASFFELMRVLVPRQRLALNQREKFSGILSRLFDLYDWAGDHKVHVQVSETPHGYGTRFAMLLC